MIRTTFVSVLLAFMVSSAFAAEPGRLTGGEKYDIPHWFKQSFLEFAEDAADAAEADRHAMVFVHAPE